MLARAMQLRNTVFGIATVYGTTTWALTTQLRKGNIEGVHGYVLSSNATGVVQLTAQVRRAGVAGLRCIVEVSDNAVEPDRNLLSQEVYYVWPSVRGYLPHLE